jgi:hypothetical protein
LIKRQTTCKTVFTFTDFPFTVYSLQFTVYSLLLHFFTFTVYLIKLSKNICFKPSMFTFHRDVQIFLAILQVEVLNPVALVPTAA